MRLSAATTASSASTPRFQDEGRSRSGRSGGEPEPGSRATRLLRRQIPESTSTTRARLSLFMTTMSPSPSRSASPMASSARATRQRQRQQQQDEQSKTERLLMTTLLRDEDSSRPTHRRRHSHAVTPLRYDLDHPPPTSSSSSSLLFQSAARAPPSLSHTSHRSRSSTPRPCTTTTSTTTSPPFSPLVYGGDAEFEVTRAYKSTHTRTTTSKRAESPSPPSSSSLHHASARSSPLYPSSPLKPQYPYPHDTTVLVSTPSYPETPSKSQKRQSLPAMPLPMTPPEKALRARLERMLLADAHAGDKGCERERERKGSNNEVRDEAGGWPWRPAAEGDTVSASTSSSSLSNSHSKSRSRSTLPSSPSHSPVTNATRPPSAFVHTTSTTPLTATSHVNPAALVPLPKTPRSPNRPPPLTLPRTPMTPRTPQTQPQAQMYAHIPTAATTTTPRSPPSQPQMYAHIPPVTTPPPPPRPPLARRTSTKSAPPREPVMMTPPPTPPLPGSGSLTPSRAIGLPTTGGRARSVVVEPLSPPPAGPRSRSVSRTRGYQGCLEQYQELRIPPGLQDYGRSPTTTTHDRQHQRRDGYTTLSPLHISCPPSYPTHADARPAIHVHADSHPNSTSTLSHSHLTQFNARRASERLRSTEGYVSFASVEGLGEPPETPVEGPGGGEERRGRGLGIRWGGGGGSVGSSIGGLGKERGGEGRKGWIGWVLGGVGSTGT